MATLSERQVLDALAAVADPDRGGDIVALGMVSGVAIRDGNVAFSIEVEPERAGRLEPLRKAAERAVEALPEVLSVTAVLTAQAAPRRVAPPPPNDRFWTHWDVSSIPKRAPTSSRSAWCRGSSSATAMSPSQSR